jgi:hypothetical protein
VLRSLRAEFDALYADSGRPSIAPEYIMSALQGDVDFYLGRRSLQSGAMRKLIPIPPAA